FFCFTTSVTTLFYLLSLHDALPISLVDWNPVEQDLSMFAAQSASKYGSKLAGRPALHNGKARNLPQRIGHTLDLPFLNVLRSHEDRKSTRLNSSHVEISYAVFCLKK